MGLNGELPRGLTASVHWTVGSGVAAPDRKITDPALFADVDPFEYTEITVAASIKGERAGEFTVARQGDEWIVADVDVEEELQRRGVATWMRSQMVEHLEGQGLSPKIRHSTAITDEAIAWALTVDDDMDAPWRKVHAGRIDEIRGRPVISDDAEPAALEAQADEASELAPGIDDAGADADSISPGL